MRLPDGEVCALASERVGERYKHEWDPRPAYECLIGRAATAGYAIDPSTDLYRSRADGLPETPRHHFNHAAGAFFGSGFRRSAVLVIDGQGPELAANATTTIWHGEGTQLDLVDNLEPSGVAFAAHSLGHFYTAIGALAGLGGLHEEGKTMGLAAYGRPSPFLDYFERFVSVASDGTYSIDPRITLAILGNTFGPKYYGWKEQPEEVQAVWTEIQALRKGWSVRARPTQDDADIAFAGQYILERVVLALAQRARAITGAPSLCIAGGVALNCVANEKIRASGLFERMFVFPAAGDEGQALGKLYSEILNRDGVTPGPFESAFLGPAYTNAEFESALAEATDLRIVTSTAETTIREAAKRLARGAILGCCRGRSELGARALGHRSIFADPRKPETRDRINFFVKGREWYRPVAPIVLERAAADYFEVSEPTPFMTFAVRVRPSAVKLVPAVVHADGTARLQTVSDGQEPFLAGILEEFSRITGLPVLVNTSFNVAGEPLVETYADAIRSFRQMPLDGLLLEDHLLVKIAA